MKIKRKSKVGKKRGRRKGVSINSGGFVAPWRVSSDYPAYRFIGKSERGGRTRGRKEDPQARQCLTIATRAFHPLTPSPMLRGGGRGREE